MFSIDLYCETPGTPSPTRGKLVDPYFHSPHRMDLGCHRVEIPYQGCQQGCYDVISGPRGQNVVFFISKVRIHIPQNFSLELNIIKTRLKK